ncbi:restriction endonuclease [Schnuerera ultunensis]|uniref:restriction endonuclease n=1 Tax=Schnuerera ultunensis TaxID=45497 RepID=UPI00138AE718|nr:restriction endonuclease [Schnuerera ultunensis]
MLLNFKDYFRRIRRQIILNSYYTNRMKDGKSIHASLMDWIFVILAVALFFAITIYNSTKKIILSLVLTSILIGFFIITLILWKGRTRYRKIKDINEDIANKQIINEIAKYGNRDFLIYIKDLLEKYYNTNFFEYNSHINFIGQVNGEIYGVKCFKSSLENKVSLKDLEHYIEEMKNKKIEEGILVTNSSFTDEVKDETDYLLVDFVEIKKMLKETKEFPKKEEIEQLIIDKYRNRKGNIKERLSFYRKDKIYKFILLGIVLYLVSSFVSYPIYYKIMSFVSIAFGIIIGIYNLVHYIERNYIE